MLLVRVRLLSPIAGSDEKEWLSPMSVNTIKWMRIGFAGPGAVVVALVIMAGMSLWLPVGAAGIDNLVLPLILVPLIWAALFFHACLDRRIGRVALIAVGLFAVHAMLIVAKFVDHPTSVRALS